MHASTLRLHAASPDALADARVRATVESAAHAIAERTGIALDGVLFEPGAIVVTLRADSLAAVGFLAELRRTTGAWFAQRNGGMALWGGSDGDDA